MNRSLPWRNIGCVVFMLVVLSLPSLSGARHDCPPHKRVFFLSSYHQGMTWTDDIVQAVESILDPIGSDLILHVEHMDTKRHQGNDYFGSLYRAYKSKYQGVSFDLILASDNQAYDFLRQHRDEIFPGVPVVFCGVNDFHKNQLAELNGFTGVTEMVDAAATLELALQNHPDTEQVFIVNDHLKTGRAWQKTIEQQLAPYASRVKLSYSENVSIDELEQQIAQLSKNSIVLLGVYFADQEGHYVTFEHIGKALMRSNSVPVYCLLDFNVGKGAIGGKVIGGRFQGEAMATIARRVLAGESIENIPVSTGGEGQYVFDAQELSRFEIDPDVLPPGAIILNQTPSAVYASRGAIHLFLTILSLSALVVFVLYRQLQKRKQRELIYRSCEARSRALLNTTAHAILGVDATGRCNFCNPQALKYLGFGDVNELLGQRLHRFFHADVSNSEMFPEDCGICQACHRGTTVHLEKTVVYRNDGISFDAELWALPVVVSGTVEGGVVSFIDISDRLAQQKKDIRTAQLVSLGELSANIAHEINNPINGVINYTQIIYNKRKDDKDIIDLLERVLQEGERVAAIVANMLKFSRDSGEQKAPAQLSVLVLEVMALLEPFVKKSAAVVTYDFEENLPPIHCNEQQVEQVLVNIVRNALQALADNHRTDRRLIISSCQFYTEGRASIRLVVANNGPHIPARLLDEIMKPFVTTKPVGSGTGLGLSITCDIMKRHGGDLEIMSEPDGLTQMILTFPCENMQQVGG